MEIAAIVLLAALVVLALPIIAIVRTSRIGELERRVQALEAALRPAIATAPQPMPEPQPEPEPAPPVVETPAAPAPVREPLEVIIGRRWLALVAVALIAVATAFFLKYAFENGWIGETGRIALGVATGLAIVFTGHNRYAKGWRYLSQVLTGGGVAILYLSTYGAFGYYRLIGPTAAFVILAVLAAEAQAMAMLYRAPLVEILALAGGFLVPVLLSTGRDRYGVLFGYIGLLDAGMLAVVLVRDWRWISSIAYLGTQGLFWAWHAEHYHPEKRAAVAAFQFAIFALFVLADLAPNLRGRRASYEQLVRLVINPLAFFGTCYGLFDRDFHNWMAVLALGLALTYAGLARLELALPIPDRRALTLMIAASIVFVTLAIPIQLRAQWITIVWAVEGVTLTWASFAAPAERLRWLAAAAFALAVGRVLFIDTPWQGRAPFTPIANRYFLGVLAVTLCLWGAAYLLRRTRLTLPALFAGFGVLWLGSSVEAYTYFSSQAPGVGSGDFETIRRLRWSGQLALSLLWSAYAGSMTAAGFRRSKKALRVAGLALFGLTLVKVAIIDISELEQFHRIVALLALGLVLLGAAWGYQKIPPPEEDLR